jgi:hypothetical protein
MFSLSAEKTQLLEHVHFYTELTIHKLLDENTQNKALNGTLGKHANLLPTRQH